MQNVLVLNSGSSSIKFQLIAMPQEHVIAKGLVEKIGSVDAQIHFETEQHNLSEVMPILDHKSGLEITARYLMHPQNGVVSSPDEINWVGHRVVHGGHWFSETTIINDEVKDKIRSLFSLAPLHNPPNLLGIEVAEDIFTSAQQVAVFDTAFHQSIPDRAYTYALPKAMMSKHHIRVYGFHGTSHKYVSEQAEKHLGKVEKLISVHLGNGCSITAIQNGKSIDHSLGFGPVSGLVMGTRSGDVDPLAVLYLMEKEGFSVEDANALITKKSGMLGLTGHSDLRDIEAKAEAGDADCQLALEINAYRVKKYIGAYVAALNGLDALIFTAGIGENSALLRKMICSDMDYFGIALDLEKNNQRFKTLAEIQSENARAKILVIPTNEELEIAKQVYEIKLKTQIG